MTNASEYLLKNKSQVEDFNQIRSEVKSLIEDNSDYKLKNIFHDGVCNGLDDENTDCGWFVELMDYGVSLEVIKLLHNYFGGNCTITTSNTISHGGITIIFSYDDIKYVKQNYEDEKIGKRRHKDG